MADRHAIIKNGCKEIAYGLGKAITFMAKWDYGMAGNSSHIHQSLWTADGKSPLFFDKTGEHGMSETMKCYLAGQLAARQRDHLLPRPVHQLVQTLHGGNLRADARHLELRQPDRGLSASAGPTARRIRVECRVGGADLNPYLAFAALLAAGLDGIERKLPLEPAFSGDAYDPAKKLREIPKTLRDATALLDGSKLLRAAMGDDVIDHYVHTARWEQFEFDRRITDLELKRGFERY